MIEIRRNNERGHADHGWLNSFHSFSFADYHDPRHVQFGPLRVLNEDRVRAGGGFPPHAHQNMEIISYVLEGALEHKDSLGNGSVIRPGDVQRMSAGTGVRHSEFNSSASELLHFLQIWLLPDVRDIAPEYEERNFDAAQKRGRLKLIASPDGRDGSVTVHQDVLLYAGLFDGDEHATLPLRPGRLGYVHAARGSLQVNGTALSAGDAAKATDVSELTIADGRQAEVLAFDLPP
jgi:redox-sensitive bicupin YhaK (pirin superfamily)